MVIRPLGKYYRQRAIVLTLLLITGVYLYVTIPGNWRMQPSVQGHWVSDSGWSIDIAPNGILTGNIGSARFHSAVVLDARGTWERLGNARPIYAMTGYLIKDSVSAAIRMPIQVGDDTLRGMFYTETTTQHDSVAVVLVRNSKQGQ